MGSIVVRPSRNPGVDFKPVQAIGPVTVGTSNGQIALQTTTLIGEEWMWIFPIGLLVIPVAIWLLQAWLWWWATSDLKFADISKIIGLLSPYFGVVSQALVT